MNILQVNKYCFLIKLKKKLNLLILLWKKLLKQVNALKPLNVSDKID